MLDYIVISDQAEVHKYRAKSSNKAMAKAESHGIYVWVVLTPKEALALAHDLYNTANS